MKGWDLCGVEYRARTLPVEPSISGLAMCPDAEDVLRKLMPQESNLLTA